MGDAGALAGNAFHIVVGALQLDPAVWRDRVAMDIAAGSATRCALTGVALAAVPGEPPGTGVALAAGAAVPGEPPGGEPGEPGEPADGRAGGAQVDHVVECWLLSTLVENATREVPKGVVAAARSAAGPAGKKAVIRKQFLTAGAGSDLFACIKLVANSTVNLAVLAPGAHAAKTAFFQVLRERVKAALKARGSPTFPSLIAVYVDMIAAGTPPPPYKYVQLWSLVYATVANELWARSQMLHSVDLGIAWFVCQRLNALGAGPGGDVFTLTDIRHLGMRARAAKNAETTDPQKLGPEGASEEAEEGEAEGAEEGGEEEDEED